MWNFHANSILAHELLCMTYILLNLYLLFITQLQGGI